MDLTRYNSTRTIQYGTYCTGRKVSERETYHVGIGLEPTGHVVYTGRTVPEGDDRVGVGLGGNQLGTWPA
jgi:hypothetical protein